MDFNFVKLQDGCPMYNFAILVQQKVMNINKELDCLQDIYGRWIVIMDLTLSFIMDNNGQQ
jgi:hypothetical protein